MRIFDMLQLYIPFTSISILIWDTSAGMETNDSAVYPHGDSNSGCLFVSGKLVITRLAAGAVKV